MRNIKIIAYFIFVFIIIALGVAVVTVPLKYAGIHIPFDYEFLVWGLLPFFLSVWYVRRKIKSGKFKDINS